jgi:Na+:H+ antiporter, NhaA family
LRDPKIAIVPIAAAIGGMALPAFVYLVASRGTGASDGWGIPVATDIALVLGLLALLGSRVSSGLKLFMLTLAIVDDLLGIGAIAIFYTDDLAPKWLLAAAAVILASAFAVRRIPHGAVILLGGIMAWYCTYESGVKPALAGAALGMMVPAGDVKGTALLTGLEHRVHPWSAFVVLPLFGLTAAPVDLSASGLSDALGSRVTWSIVAGAVIGKLIGITGATLLVVGLGQRLPAGMSRRDAWAAGALGGVGFSVALFIASAAFGAAPKFLAHARIGVLGAGIIAATLGVGVLTFSSPGRRGASTEVP